MVAQSLRRASPCSCSSTLFSIGLGIASLAIVAVYPLMKRVTSWPQAVLGLAFSWGALMGWAATFASLVARARPALPRRFCWTIGYDTIYAMQDARDDAIVGIRSTARLFAGHTRLGVGMFYALAAALWRSAAILLAGRRRLPLALLGWLAYAAHLGWQLSRVEGADAATALSLFRSNRDAGLLLFAGIAAQGWAG